MCIYTLKNQILKNSSGGGGCATPSNIPQLAVSDVKDTAKTNKD